MRLGRLMRLLLVLVLFSRLSSRMIVRLSYFPTSIHLHAPLSHERFLHGPDLGSLVTDNVPPDLGEAEIIKLCEICSNIGVAFVKTSTGYGFVKQPNGDYNYKGATIEHLELMKKHVTGSVRIKAAGGVRTLDDLLRVMAVGVSRVGATATGVILDEAVRRGIGNELVEVTVPPFPEVGSASGGY